MTNENPKEKCKMSQTDRLDEIPHDKLVATFCSGGDRANVAFAYLHTKGFDNARIIRAG